MFSAKSSTSNIAVLAVPSVVYTVPANFTKTVIDVSGLVDANAVKVGPSGSGTAQTARDLGASVLLSSGTGTGQVSLSSGKVLLQATQTGVTIPTVTTLTNAPSDSSGVTTLLSRIPSGLFTGITSLAQWLGLLAGKQTGNSTARTEIRATGAGSGTFDETTDSQEAIRDRGDAAWPTATGFSTLDEAGVRSAVGLGAANLDDQLGDLASAADLATVDANVDSILEDTGTTLPATLGSPAGASLAADVAAVKTDTNAIKAVTDALPDDGALSSLATAASIAALNDLDASGVRAAVGLASANLDTQLGAIPTAAENADAVCDEALSGHATSGTVGKALADTISDATAIKAVTDALPDAGALSSLATASSVAALPTATDVAGAVWDVTASEHDATGSTGKALTNAGAAGTPPSASEIAGAVWDEDLSGHTTDGTAGDTLGNVATGTPPSAAAIADAVLDEALSGHASAGTLGKAISDTATAASAIQERTDNLPDSPAAIGDAMTLMAAYDAAKTAAQAGDAMTLTGAYDAAKSAAQAGDAMALTSGERTTLAGVVWATLTSALTTAGSIGKKLADWVLGTDHKALVSFDTHTGGVTVAAVTGAVGSVTGNVDGSVASVIGAVGSVTGDIGGNVTGTVGGLSTQAKADVNAEVDAAIGDASLATASDVPSASTVAAAVLSAAESTPIKANTKQINDITVVGTGQSGDQWRPAS
jgi:hypothetical protein